MLCPAHGAGGGVFNKERQALFSPPFTGRTDSQVLRTLRRVSTRSISHLHHFDLYHPSFNLQLQKSVFSSSLTRELGSLLALSLPLGNFVLSAEAEHALPSKGDANGAVFTVSGMTVFVDFFWVVVYLKVDRTSRGELFPVFLLMVQAPLSKL